MSLVVCFGNPQRGDDAFGPVVAEVLKARAAFGAEVTVMRDDALALLDAWGGHEHVVVVDAISIDRAPGTLLHFDVSDVAVPAEFGASSTHTLGPAGAIEIARALGELPARVEILAAVGDDFEHGRPLSPPLEAAVERAVERIVSLFESGD